MENEKVMIEDGITEEGLTALVDRFYAKVREDAALGPIFNGAIHDWPEHLERLQAFWSSVMLTSGRYKGQPLPAHFRHEAAITPALFERWLGLWRETTNELMAPHAAAALQEKAGRIAQSLTLGLEDQRERLRRQAAA
jgi:hemoglobin